MTKNLGSIKIKARPSFLSPSRSVPPPPASLLYSVPMAFLGAVIDIAVIQLLDFQEMWRALWIAPIDFLVRLARSPTFYPPTPSRPSPIPPKSPRVLSPIAAQLWPSL